MFSTVSQVSANSQVLAELASSGAVSDPTFYIWGVLGACIVATLASSYLMFGKSGRQS